MQLGMPTLIETKTLEESAKLCRELGLNFIEINMNMPQYQVDKLDVARFSEIASEYGIYYTIHLEENFAPCDFNKRVSAAYVETALHTIEVAKQLSSPIVNMHLADGIHFKLPHKKAFLFDEYDSEYSEKLIAFRDACEIAIGNLGIKVCVENCHGYNRAPFMKKSLDLLLGSPVFGLTFDIGHNEVVNFEDEPIIFEYADRLCHFHIHDSVGGKPHLPFGEGELDLKRYIDLVNSYNARAVLETKTIDALKKSIDWLKARKLGLISQNMSNISAKKYVPPR